MAENIVEYLCFDILTNQFLGDLQGLYGVTFSNVLNGSGPFSGKLNTKHLAAIRNRNGLSAEPAFAMTNPNHTILVITVNGAVRWSGIITDRNYQHTTGEMSLSGMQLEGYLASLTQTRDYAAHWPGNGSLNSSGSTLTYSSSNANFWLTNPIPPAQAAAKVIGDTLYDYYTAYSSIPASAFTSGNAVSSSCILNSAVKAHFYGGYPAANWWTNEQWPLTGRSSLSQLLSTMSTEHVTCGFDWAWTASLSGTALSFSLDLYWPRMGYDSTGTNGGSLGSNTNKTGLLTISQQGDGLDYTYPESGGQQATRLYAISGGIKGYRLGVGDVLKGISWTATSVTNLPYFDYFLPAGTKILLCAGSTAYPATVVHTTPVGIFGVQWKIKYSGSYPSSFTAGQPLTAVIQGGPTVAGYPPIDKTSSYTHTKSDLSIRAAAFGELAAEQWPLTTPTVTVRAFGPSGFGACNVGDDIRWIIEPDERFVNGLDTYWRVTQAAWTIAGDGMSTCVYTLDVPPSTALANGGFPGFRPPTA